MNCTVARNILLAFVRFVYCIIFLIKVTKLQLLTGHGHGHSHGGGGHSHGGGGHSHGGGGHSHGSRRQVRQTTINNLVEGDESEEKLATSGPSISIMSPSSSEPPQSPTGKTGVLYT